MRAYSAVVLIACVVLGCGRLASAVGASSAEVVPRQLRGQSLIPTRQLISVPLGQRSIDITVADTGVEVTFIRVHQNEMPAGTVGAQINREVPSRFIDLSHQRSRHVTLTLAGADYSVDPNTVFSPGVAPSALGVRLPKSATEATERLGRVIASMLLPDAPVVALHNNRGTLLNRYASGSFKTCTHDVYVNPRMDASTFAVVPTKALFDAVKALGINVVWENRAGAHDDGSLLAYAQRRNIPYVNVEAGLGSAADAQLAIVRQMVALLRAAPTAAALAAE